jgi:hypothetical protein
MVCRVASMTASNRCRNSLTVSSIIPGGIWVGRLHVPSLNAARRAAHLLERRGQVQVLHVAVPAGLDQKGGTFLVRRGQRWGSSTGPRECTTPGRHGGPTTR